MGPLGIALIATAAGGIINKFLGGGGGSSGSGSQTTRMTPAPRTSEGNIIWNDFMNQLYGMGRWKAPATTTTPPVIRNLLASRTNRPGGGGDPGRGSRGLSGGDSPGGFAGMG